MTETSPWAAWQSRIAAAKRRVDDRIAEWQENVDARKGGTKRNADTVSRSPQTGQPLVSINQDWPLTKAKLAQLYSQTPEVRLEPKGEQFQQAVTIFGKELNDTIAEVNVGATIEEVAVDVVNAAGIGAALVSCEIRTEDRIDPVLGIAVPYPAGIRYLCQRISPADLLVPSDFTGSDYNQAQWLGERGRMTWASAKSNFRLDDSLKEKVVGSDTRAGSAQRSLNTDSDAFRDSEVVQYTQLFYWRHYYHPDETHFQALQRLVFVDGLDEPVVDEVYTAQKRTEDGRLIGVTEMPIRILTLTYVSDEGLPPSDSSIGRFQVDELESSRDAMVQQRRHSIPLRWFNTNMVGPNTRNLLEKGDYQGFIGINGRADNAIGEVARASYPAERFEFDRVIKNDLTEIWQVGTNQAGAFASGERSAREAGIIERNFQRRVGQEQDKVSKFFLGIVRVLAGHLALYGRFPLPDTLGAVRQELGNGFSYSTRVDATMRLDADEQIERLTKGLNLTAQSGYVNPKPIITKIWELLGVDPAEVVVDPQPKPPDPVKLNVSKAEDLNDPMFLAMLMRTQQAPTPEDVAAADKLLEVLRMKLAVPNVPMEMAGPPMDPMTPEISNRDWQTAPHVDKRAEDGGL